MSVNIFTKQTEWFRLTCTVCTSITSRTLHLKSSRSSNSCKSLTKYCSNTIDASHQQVSARLDSANYITPSLLLYRYSLRTLFEVLKTHLGGQAYKKPEDYQEFFCFQLRVIPILSSIDRWKDFRIRRGRQADGDDHWPVTVTSKNEFPRCPNCHLEYKWRAKCANRIGI